MINRRKIITLTDSSGWQDFLFQDLINTAYISIYIGDLYAYGVENVRLLTVIGFTTDADFGYSYTHTFEYKVIMSSFAGLKYRITKIHNSIPDNDAVSKAFVNSTSANYLTIMTTNTYTNRHLTVIVRVDN